MLWVSLTSLSNAALLIYLFVTQHIVVDIYEYAVDDDVYGVDDNDMMTFHFETYPSSQTGLASLFPIELLATF